jgi:hypothetical protein
MEVRFVVSERGVCVCVCVCCFVVRRRLLSLSDGLAGVRADWPVDATDKQIAAVGPTLFALFGRVGWFVVRCGFIVSVQTLFQAWHRRARPLSSCRSVRRPQRSH